MRNKQLRIIIGAITTATALALTGCATSAQGDNNSSSSSATNVIDNISDNAKDGINKGTQLTPSNVTPEGTFRISNANTLNEDAYRLDTFIDPACGACQAVEAKLGEQWLEGAKNGEIDYHISPVPFLDFQTTGDYSTRASNAFVTIAEQDPIMAAKFFNKIFEPSFFPNHGPAHRKTSDLDIAEVAKEVGASDELIEKISQHHYVDWLEKNTEKLARKTAIFPEGISTPTVLINLEFDGEGTLITPPGETQKITFTGNIEGDYDYQLEKYLA